jgi:DNA-binding response OmpR family regulator
MSRNSDSPRNTDAYRSPGARADAGRPEVQRPPAPPARASGADRPAQKKRVLVVDDEKDLVELISFNLVRNGYEAVPAHNGNEALEAALANPPDLIVLDIMLPGLSGTEVARRLKSDPRTASVPIVMLTARGEETDVVVGLTLGADDYVTKPFSMKILLARLSSVLRRSEPAATAAEGASLRAGPLTIDTLKHEVAIDNEPIKLTLTEFKLLSALVLARGRVLTRDQLMDKAMGSDVFVTDRAIDVHITAIRKKLGSANWLVHTVRGVGYRLRESAGEPD